MPLRPENLSSDPAHLTEMLLASEAENARLRATIVQLKGMIFGSRSERRVTLIAEQLPLDLDDRTPGSTAEILAPEPANDDQSNKGGSSDKPGGKRNRIIGALPKHLPRVDLLIGNRCLCPTPCDFSFVQRRRLVRSLARRRLAA